MRGALYQSIWGIRESYTRRIMAACEGFGDSDEMHFHLNCSLFPILCSQNVSLQYTLTWREGALWCNSVKCTCKSLRFTYYQTYFSSVFPFSHMTYTHDAAVDAVSHPCIISFVLRFLSRAHQQGGNDMQMYLFAWGEHRRRALSHESWCCRFSAGH